MVVSWQEHMKGPHWLWMCGLRMPWIMALDRTNYARNIPVFLRDLCVLKENDLSCTRSSRKMEILWVKNQNVRSAKSPLISAQNRSSVGWSTNRLLLETLIIQRLSDVIRLPGQNWHVLYGSSSKRPQILKGNITNSTPSYRRSSRYKFDHQTLYFLEYSRKTFPRWFSVSQFDWICTLYSRYQLEHQIFF